jgi:hypothetical protein
MLLLALAGVASAASRPGQNRWHEDRGQGAPTIRVPQDQPTLRDAIEASQPGTLILLDRGTYLGGDIVPADKPGITIRGVDRNEVVFDGRDEVANALVIEADNVTVENMTAHNYVGNGFYWTGVEGYAGRYLTVWNVGLYGIYAIESRDGVFEHSYVSGAADAAFYIGECNPCDAVVTDVVARLSAVGYSGTNAGGNLKVRDSLWELNGTAIMPNSYEGQPLPPPQRESIISGNTIRDSNAQPVPANSPLAGFVGVGIAIAGGWENVVEGNDISGSAAYGIALFPTLQQNGNAIVPDLNVIRDNVITDSGTADLGVATGSAESNCFTGNQFSTSLPADIEAVLPCDGDPATDGDDQVMADLGIPVPEALNRLGPRPQYSDMPRPDDQPNMPNGTSSPSQEPPSPGPPTTPTSGASVAPSATPATPSASEATSDPIGIVALVGVLLGVTGAVGMLFLLWQRQRR